MPKILPRKCKDDEYYQKAADIVQKYIEKFGAGFHEIDELDCMIASALREAAEQSVHLTGGILRDFQALSTGEQNPAPEELPTPPASR